MRDAKYHVNHVAEPKTHAKVLIDGELATYVWTATYLHVLQGENPVLDWLRCTVLPPLLAKLSASDVEEFSTQLAAELRRAYPPGPSGTQFPVRRVFALDGDPEPSVQLASTTTQLAGTRERRRERRDCVGNDTN